MSKFEVVSYSKGHEAGTGIHPVKFNSLIAAACCCKARRANQERETAKIYEIDDVFGAAYPVALESVDAEAIAAYEEYEQACLKLRLALHKTGRKAEAERYSLV